MTTKLVRSALRSEMWDIPFANFIRPLQSLNSFFTFLYHPRLQDLDFLYWAVLGCSLYQTHPLNYPQPIFDSPKNCMLPIQPRCWGQGDEELTTVRVGATVRHAQYTSTCMLERWINLVFKLLPIYRSATAASACRIARLQHEVGDDSVEDDIVVVAALG